MQNTHKTRSALTQMVESYYHILLVTFPAQGHINPSLQFAKRLVKIGTRVTFVTSSSALRCMKKAPEINGITFVHFSDGYDNGWTKDVPDFMSQFKKRGSKAISKLIIKKQEEGDPFSRVIYTTLLAWVGQVAHDLQAPSTLLWIQPATIFDVYFYYLNNQDYVPSRIGVIELPGLPVFERDDLPSFLLGSSPSVYNFVLPTFREHFEVLDQERSPKVLVNTFDALEVEPLRIVEKYNLIAIGPLIPSAFLDGKDPSDTSFGGDLIEKTVEYVEWLDSKEKSSVVYVAFGSYSEVSKSQIEEIAKGLIKVQKPFLWVIRGSENREKLGEILSCVQELETLGKIVPWCTQVEVLSHPNVGCFLTHCGWNSTLESLSSGVPVVAFPQWTDQATNAKLIQDYWKSGVRVKANDVGVVEGDEFKRCLEIVMCGEKGEDMRKQAKTWKELAKESMKEDGTSNVNLKIFMGDFDGTAPLV